MGTKAHGGVVPVNRGRMRCLDTGDSMEFWRIRSRVTLPVLSLPPGATGWRHDVDALTGP